MAGWGKGGGNNFPYILLTLSLPIVPLIDFTLFNARRFYSSMGNPTGLKGLNEIQTMFSQLAKQSWRHQTADSCTAHEQSLSSRSVNKARNMAADAGAKCGGFFLVYFEALQFGKFTSSWTSFLSHSSFSEIKVRQHFVNVYFFVLKKAS